MSRAKRGKSQPTYRPIWEKDRFWKFEEIAGFKTIIENPGADDIRIDRFSGRFAA